MRLSAFRPVLFGAAVATLLLGQDWNALSQARGWARQDITGAFTFLDADSMNLRTWTRDGSTSGVLTLPDLGAIPTFWCLDVKDQAWVVAGTTLYHVDRAGKVIRKEILPAEVSDLVWDGTGFYLSYRLEAPFIEKRENKRGTVEWTYGAKPKKGAPTSSRLFRLALSGAGQLYCTLGVDPNLLSVDTASGKELGRTALALNQQPAPFLQTEGQDRQPLHWWPEKGVLLANVPGSQLPQKAAGQYLARLNPSQGTLEFLPTGLDEGSLLVGIQEGEAAFVKPGGGMVFLALK